MSSKSHFFSNPYRRLNNSNVISLWDFDGGALLQNNDKIGSNNGVAEGGNSYPNAVIGKGKDFTGGNLTILNNLNLSFTDGVNDVAGSVSMLVNFNDITGNQFLMCKRNFNGGLSSVDKEWQIFYNGTDFRFIVFDEVLGGNIRITHPFTPTISQYYSLTCTYDGSGLHTGLKMYLDGVSVGITSLTGSYTKTYNFSNDMTLGVNSWLRTLRHKGIGDEYKKWSIELTSEEAMYLATQELAGNKIIG